MSSLWRCRFERGDVHALLLSLKDGIESPPPPVERHLLGGVIPIAVIYDGDVTIHMIQDSLQQKSICVPLWYQRRCCSRRRASKLSPNWSDAIGGSLSHETARRRPPEPVEKVFSDA